MVLIFVPHRLNTKHKDLINFIGFCLFLMSIATYFTPEVKDSVELEDDSFNDQNDSINENKSV